MGRSAKRGADMVRQLLTFAKGIEGERQLLQLNHLLKELEKIIEGTFPKSIARQISYSRDLWPILGDATQLHQVHAQPVRECPRCHAQGRHADGRGGEQGAGCDGRRA